MRILHIGDYHFKPRGTNYEQTLMVNKMIENLKKKEKIDIVVFSGDLVNSGSDYSNFELAHGSLFKKLSEELEIPLSHFIIAAGNHDIRREDSLKAIINYYDSITDSDNLNQEYTRTTEEYKLSIKPCNNYFKYVNNFYSYLEIEKLYSLAEITIQNKKISFVILNSAWLSSGHRDDNGKLMLPSLVLKDAIQKSKSSDLKILITHHPLSNFREFNSLELEDLVHKNFDWMLSGHIHKEQICTKYAGQNGIYSNTTQATLTFDKDGEIGYSIINCQLDQPGELMLERASYLRKENKFLDLSVVYVTVPYGEEKAQQNKLRNKIISKFVTELNSANELLLEYDEEKGKNFLEIFTTPVLSTNSGTENANTEKHGYFHFENLYSEDTNYLIFGKDKSGKTSLLKKLQLYFLKNYSQLSKVPFYLDYKELAAKEGNIDIKKLIRNYYEIPNVDAEKLINEGRIIFLIDNLNTNSVVNEIIVSFLGEHKNIQFVICSEFIASRVYFEELDHLTYSKIYFKDLTRKEIRIYSQKYNSVKQYNEEEVLEKISKMLQQLQLPLNYWTISLLLLIYKKSNDDYNKNLFGILDLCVDEILQKKQLSLTKSKLSFEQYKELCSRIAYYLLMNYKDDVYSASAASIISHIDTLITGNIRLVADAKEIFDYLLDVGIFKEKNSKYTFRLNGLFEYFLAFYISQHPEFKSEILKDNSIYLMFKNELEIYSGLNRNDEEFLKNIFSKTKNVFDTIINTYKTSGSLDKTLMNKLGEVNLWAERIKKMKVKGALSHEFQDSSKDIIDPLSTASEVKLKDFIDANNITAEVLEKYLAIFSRVYKNSDNIRNTELEFKIFDYLLEAYISFGFYLIDQYSKFSTDEEFEDDDTEAKQGKNILKVLTNFIPLISQVLMYDGIGHPNLATIIMKHIEKYTPDANSNQYKLYLLYFLLIDLDVKANKKYIDQVFNCVTLSPLKVSTFFKLNFYMAFKAYQNKDLENYFKTKVKEAQIRMDSKSGEAKTMDKTLSNKQKANLVRKIRRL